MSKQKLKHIRSGVENKKPTPEQIDLGVIAVNFNTNNPFLSIKDSNDEIVSFPSEKGIEPIVETEVNEVAPGIIQEILPTVIGEDYYTKQQTDAEINALSASTDTKLEQKADKSEIPSLDGYATEQWVTDQHYLTQHQDISGLATKQEVEDGLAGKSNTGHTHTVSDITNFPSIPTRTSDLTNDSGFITSGYTYSKAESDDKYALKGDVPTDVYTKTETDEAISGATQDMATMTWVGEQGYLTEHQSLDNYYTKVQVDNEISGATQDMATETWVQNQGYLTEHQDISNLATKQEVNDLSGATDTKLALKADLADIPDVSNYFDDAQYDSNTKRINFYHGETIKAYVDATDFIKDGMVDTVSIETLSGSTYLVITFNTDSGKEPINIPIADIFNAANYYTKSEVDNAITGATQDMATQTWVTSQGYLTQHQDISNLATKQEVETLSGDTDTKLAGKQDTLVAGENITISGNTISATGGGGGGGMTEDTELLLATAITDLNDRKADRSLVNSKFSSLNNKFGNYVTTTTLNTRLADYETALDEQNVEEVTSYALNDLNNRKQDKLIAGEGISISGNTISATGGGGGGGSITIDPALNPTSSNAVANSAITEAISAKFDASGITDYYTSSQVDSAISQSVSGKQDTLIAGEGISISGNTISATGGGGGTTYTAGTNMEIDGNNAINCTIPFTSYPTSAFDSKSFVIGRAIDGSTYSNIGIGRNFSIDVGCKESVFIMPCENEYSTNKVYQNGEKSVVIGYGSCTRDGNRSSASLTVAIGCGAETSKHQAIAIGVSSEGNALKSIAIGRLAKTELEDSVAIGTSAQATGTTKTNLNNQIKVDTSNQVYIYNKENTEMVCLQDYLGGGGGGTTYTAGDGISISGTTISAVPDASITSGSTNSVQSAAIYTQFDGMQLKKITQADYDLLPTKDSNTLYIITNSN